MDNFTTENDKKIEEYQKALWREVEKKINEYLKSVIEHLLNTELTKQLKAGWHERTGERTNWRNGSYERELSTLYGTIPNLEVPRPRSGVFETELFDRYQRRQSRVDSLIGELFLKGVSTRSLNKISKELTGKSISAGTVSSINKEIDDSSEEFRKKNLKDEYVFLFFDGIVQKTRDFQKGTDRVCLCALGIKTNGEKELLSFQVAEKEDEENWRRFVIDLKQRGISGKMTKLITTDGNQGLISALNDIYPFVKRQRCIVHKLRNVAQKVSKRKNLKNVMNDASAVFNCLTKTEAVQKLKEFNNKWQIIEERAVVCLEEDLSETLKFFDFEEKHWKLIRTTNVLERSFREVRRRTDNIGSFANEDSLERITYGIFNNLNEQWAQN